MIASFSIVPLDKGESVSEYVAICVSLVRDSGLPYQLTPMATVVEGELDEVMGLIALCHRTMRRHSRRVLTRVEIDDREGRDDALHQKVESVRARLQDM
ncbi:MAG: MTH1187 family thiamine-binding protein [Candidatus Methanomethylophilaceae archaeon]